MKRLLIRVLTRCLNPCLPRRGWAAPAAAVLAGGLAMAALPCGAQGMGAAAPQPAAVADAPPERLPAETSLLDRVSVNTFGTLGLARVNLAGVRLISDAAATTGIGSEWTGAYDSRLGLQLAARVTPTLDLTWQSVLRRQSGDDVRLATNWAYANWQVTPAWEIKLGRYMSPLYLASDQRLIGLAQPWVRAPTEVYGLLGNVDSLDGLWVRRQIPLGEETLSLDFYRARHLDDRGDISVNHRRLTGVSLNLRDARFTWHAMLAQSRTEIRSPSTDALAAAIANPALGGDPAVARDYDLGRIDRIQFAAVGVRYEADPWLLMSEFVLRRSASKALPGSTAGYLTVGRTWGPVLGYVTLAGVRGTDPGSETRLSGVAAGIAEDFLAFGREYGQTSLGTGLRWDLRRGVALKAQVDRLQARTEGRGGTFLDGSGRYSLPDGRHAAWLYSLMLDWAY